MITRKLTDIYHIHKTSMVFHVVLLVKTFCTFLSARCLAAFVELFTAFDYEKGLHIIVVMAAVFTASLLCTYVKKRFWSLYRERKNNELQSRIYETYLRRAMQADSEGKLSVLCEKDIPECVNFFTEKIPLAVQAAVGIVAYAVYLVCMPGGIGVLLILLVLGTVQFLPPLIAEKYLVRNYIAAGQAEECVRQEIISGLSGIFSIKMYNLYDWFMRRYQERLQEFQKVGERAAGTSSIQTALYSGVLLLEQIGFLVIGIPMVAYGGMSLETLILGYGLSASFYQYMAKLGALKADFGVCRAALERLSDFMQEQKEQNVPYYEDLTMELPSERLWLIKGENGAGKSTLISVIAGARHSGARVIWKGEELDEETRLEKTSWCPQLYLKISDSFWGLVELMSDDVLDKEILQKYIHQFELDSKLLEKPLQELSGGQQKKLMLILALARKSDILLLDEPEVSLDWSGCESLKGLLEKENRLILLVTHSHVFDEMADGTILVKGGEICA